MPTDSDIDNNEGTNDDGGADHSAPAAKDLNFRLDTAELSREIARGVQEGFRSMVNESRQQAPDPEEQPFDISEDDDQATITRKIIHNEMIPMRRQLKEVTNVGYGKFGEIQHQLTLTNLPYYKEFKAEIDAQVGQLPANLRADSNVLRSVYNNVVATHVDEIANRRADEQKRQLLQSDEPPAPGGSNTRTQRATGGNKIPTPEEMGFDDEQVAEIDARGGPDRFARAISGGRYQNWADYAAGKAKMEQTQKTARGRVIPFARIDTAKKTA